MRRGHKRLATIRVWVAVLGGLVTTSALAFEGAADDDNKYPTIVELVRSSGSSFCSGTYLGAIEAKIGGVNKKLGIVVSALHCLAKFDGKLALQKDTDGNIKILSDFGVRFVKKDGTALKRVQVPKSPNFKVLLFDNRGAAGKYLDVVVFAVSMDDPGIGDVYAGWDTVSATKPVAVSPVSDVFTSGGFGLPNPVTGGPRNVTSLRPHGSYLSTNLGGFSGYGKDLLSDVFLAYGGASRPNDAWPTPSMFPVPAPGDSGSSALKAGTTPFEQFGLAGAVRPASTFCVSRGDPTDPLSPIAMDPRLGALWYKAEVAWWKGKVSDRSLSWTSQNQYCAALDLSLPTQAEVQKWDGKYFLITASRPKPGKNPPEFDVQTVDGSPIKKSTEASAVPVVYVPTLTSPKAGFRHYVEWAKGVASSDRLVFRAKEGPDLARSSLFVTAYIDFAKGGGAKKLADRIAGVLTSFDDLILQNPSSASLGPRHRFSQALWAGLGFVGPLPLGVGILGPAPLPTPTSLATWPTPTSLATWPTPTSLATWPTPTSLATWPTPTSLATLPTVTSSPVATTTVATPTLECPVVFDGDDAPTARPCAPAILTSEYSEPADYFLGIEDDDPADPEF